MSLSSSLSLDHRIRASVLETIQELQNSGELLPNDQLQDYHARFSGLFGPEKLMDLDGEALLDRMHSLRACV